MSKALTKRVKSFLWRAVGLAVVGCGAYFLKIGDLWAIDWHTLVNIGLVAIVGLAVNEVTKWLNPSTD